MTYKGMVLLLATCLTAILIPLCFTGPAVVLPSINSDLGGSAVELNWVMNAYILTYGSAMMASGSLSDIYGRKKVWLIGMTIFCIATFAIPYSESVLQIDILRLLQGLGGAAAFASAMASLAQSFHGAARTRVFSLLGTTFGIGLAFGPLSAGYLVDALDWRWVFFTTGFIGILAFVLVLISATESRDPNATGMDWTGAILFTAALSLFTYGVLLAPDKGWADAGVAASIAISAVLFVAFVVTEKLVKQPMLDLGLFSKRRFVGVQLLAASPAFFFVLLIVMLPARFIGIDGMSALQAGQFMVALAAPLLVVPFLAGILSRRFTSGALSGFGLFLVAIGLTWLGSTINATDHSQILLPMALIGVGIGLPWGLMDGMAVSVVEKERAGMATGIFNCVRVSADGVAIAVIGALLATLIHSDLVMQFLPASSSALLEAANRAALGDLSNASVLLNNNSSSLYTSYQVSFERLLYVLSGAAVLTALLVFALLGKVRAHDSSEEAALHLSTQAENNQ